MQLHCPVCGEGLDENAACFTGLACPFCGKISVRRSCAGARSRAERAALPLGPPPEGVELTEDAFLFRCDITKSDGVGPAVLWLITAFFFVTALIQLFHGRTLSSADFWVVFAIFFVLLTVLAGSAAYFTFGTDSVIGTAETLEFRSGLRRWAASRSFRHEEIRRIVVARRTTADSEGAARPELVLRCELADGRPDFCFAAGQSYPRLAWVARYLEEQR